ncbi:LacI family DNA-binding transcriptional regulator [Jatrophihabitans sp. YIM 134969]
MAKRPTIADIAALAGVSAGAVSYALNGLPGVSEQTRARIIAIADEIGWAPNVAARSLTVSRAQAVGWVIARPTPTLGVEPFFTQLIAGLEAELSRSRVALLLQVVDDHDAASAATRRWWAERRIDGVIVTDVWAGDQRLPALQELGVPTVLVGRPQPGVNTPAVWSDEAGAVAGVVDYLVALGHRRIARVAGMSRLDHTRVRTRAFRARMRHHGLTDPRVEVTDYSSEQGARATRTLLTSPDRPTAITYDNDVMAVAALAVAREMGVAVPEELSIVSGEDSELTVLVSPSLTALSRDIAAYGSTAARTLLQVVGGEAIDSVEIPAAHLVPRGSTGPIRR